VREEGLQVTGLCRGGFFPAPDAAGRQVAIDDNRRAVDEAAALGAPCLVIVVGGLPHLTRPGSTPSNDIAASRSQVIDGIAEMLDYAETAGIPMALEPLHPMMAAERSCLCTLRQALDICDMFDPTRSRGLGVAIDVYHVWWDAEIHEQIVRAGNRILTFHVCDWLVPTTSVLSGRGMMGDGIIEIAKLRAAVEAQGFAGACEVEVLSDHWWSRPIDEVLSVVVERYRSAC
jgi:sugar phosphate isomerase/epimerase